MHQLDSARRVDVDGVHVKTCNTTTTTTHDYTSFGQTQATPDDMLRWCPVETSTPHQSQCRNVTDSSASRGAWVYFVDPSDPELVVRENSGQFPEESGREGVLTWPSWHAQMAALFVSIASLHEVGTGLDIWVLVRT